MKILLFGKNGQLGWELERALAPLGTIYALGLDELDLVQLDMLRAHIRKLQPQVIVNASAYTAVDRAEEETDLARAINVEAPRIMAEESRSLGGVMIHYSTDYVFDGRKTSAYTEADETNPLNVYGQSKLEGEQAIRQVGGAHVILRTSWVYSLRGDGFVSKVLKWARTQNVMRVVSDQVGSPTWARPLAEVTSLMLARGLDAPTQYFSERAGVYHLGGEGSVSRLDFSRAIVELDPKREEQTVQRLDPALTADFPTPALRPLTTTLDCAKFSSTFNLRLPNWKDALRLALQS